MESKAADSRYMGWIHYETARLFLFEVDQSLFSPLQSLQDLFDRGVIRDGAWSSNDNESA